MAGQEATDFRQGWTTEELAEALASVGGDFPLDESVIEGRLTDSLKSSLALR